jgi:hypothetical protein
MNKNEAAYGEMQLIIIKYNGKRMRERERERERKRNIHSGIMNKTYLSQSYS